MFGGEKIENSEGGGELDETMRRRADKVLTVLARMGFFEKGEQAEKGEFIDRITDLITLNREVKLALEKQKIRLPFEENDPKAEEFARAICDAFLEKVQPGEKKKSDDDSSPPPPLSVA